MRVFIVMDFDDESGDRPIAACLTMAAVLEFARQTTAKPECRQQRFGPRGGLLGHMVWPDVRWEEGEPFSVSGWPGWVEPVDVYPPETEPVA